MKTVRARVVGARREPGRGADAYRTTVDFAQLFREGAPVSVSGYPCALLTEALDGENDAVIAILIKVPADKVDAVKTHGLALLDLWRRWGPMLLGMMRGA